MKKEALKDENYFIVRGDRSGVFFGKIKERKGQDLISQGLVEVGE